MIQQNLSDDSIGKALRLALSQEIIREEDTAVIFYDLDFLESRIRYLASCFPQNTLHGLAIKANPLSRIMEFVKNIAPNIGVEAASIGEVTMALRAGFRPGQVVFDSPVKTVADIRFALAKGIHLNVDNLSELERVNKALAGSCTPTTSVGLRINPQVGMGTILESSVAGEYSKFGVPVKNGREGLELAFLTHPWLTGVHLHVGSQGCAMQMLTDGIGVLYDFVLEMNEQRIKLGFPLISVFDIGGGLPIAYDRGTQPPSMKEYVEKIAQRAPQLFNPDAFRLITEFGRWSYTNSGWTASRVEYVKRDAAINTAMIHVGADLFVRECLNPRDWHHEYSVFDKNGLLKSGNDTHPYNLAGPLCFSGDIIAKNVVLPVIEEGDFLVIHDTGGYTFSMWSRYNSRQTPGIIGYRDDRFEVLKERETLEELYRFWE
ncbi:MAG: diaminopimelate decarboxylase [Bacteroidetes bacterium]|nr:diaminopimelate decarboxylase [Bacteroidota bacterium]